MTYLNFCHFTFFRRILVFFSCAVADPFFLTHLCRLKDTEAAVVHGTHPVLPSPHADILTCVFILSSASSTSNEMDMLRNMRFHCFGAGACVRDILRYEVTVSLLQSIVPLYNRISWWSCKWVPTPNVHSINPCSSGGELKES